MYVCVCARARVCTFHFRFNAIYRYGGAYQDFDCVWTNRVPDHLLEFPMVIAPAIGRVGNWPDGLAAGMFMARPGAPFLRQIIKNYRHYYRSVYLFNAIMLPYRSYEHYPDAIRVDPHFTVSYAVNELFVWLLS